MDQNGRKEAPYIPMGIFKLRLPFIHYRWELAETIQAFFLFSVAMAAIPFIQEAFPWVSFEVAWTAVFWFTVVFWLTATLGDPTAPGWITAAIPVVLLYVKGYPEGAERVWALTSVQLVLSVLCLVTGPTGLADWLNKRVPAGLRAGIVLGAGISAIMSEIRVGGRFLKSPVSIGIATFISFYLLWSISFKKVQSKNGYAKSIAKYGYVPALIIGAIVALIFKEAPIPTIEWGIFVPRFAEQFRTMSIFGYGFPPLSHLVTAVPTAFVVYVILFGDWLIIDALRTEAMKERKDEYIDFSIARSSVITAIRNAWSAILAPYATTSGPLWAGVTVSVYERYKMGKQGMPNIWGGLLSFQMWWPILVFAVPLITLMKPFLPLAASTTLLIQGFACSYIAMLMSRDKLDLGIAGIVGVVLWRFGAAYALGVGIVLWVILMLGSDEPTVTAQKEK
jgi:hypothetical protein